MSNLGINFGNVEAELSGGFPFPKGKFPCQIINFDARATKNQKGYGVQLTWECIAGEYNGRQVKIWYNTQHQNMDAERIGHEQLKKVGLATQCPQFLATSDVQHLLGKQAVLVVGENKKDDLEVKSYEPMNDPQMGNAAGYAGYPESQSPPPQQQYQPQRNASQGNPPQQNQPQNNGGGSYPMWPQK